MIRIHHVRPSHIFDLASSMIIWIRSMTTDSRTRTGARPLTNRALGRRSVAGGLSLIYA